MISCVAFDFDGTLVNSNRIKNQTFYDVTQPYDPDGSTVTRILQQHPNHDRYGIFHEIVRDLSANGHPALLLSQETLAAQWAEAYTVACEQAIAHCPEVPGTSEILNWISSHHIPIFVNSRTPITTLRRLIATRSFNHYITDVYGAPTSKSENLQRIQERTRKPLHEILMVGDSEDDRKAASEVGCNFVGVNLGKDIGFDFRPNYTVNNLTKLKIFINSGGTHYNDTTNNY